MYKQFDATILKAGDEVGIRIPGNWESRYRIATVKRVTKTFVEIATPRFNEADHVTKYSVRTNEEMNSLSSKYYRPELVAAVDAKVAMARKAEQQDHARAASEVQNIQFKYLTADQLARILAISKEGK